MATLTEITTGQDETTVWQRLLTRLQGWGLPALSWATGDPISVILRHGLSPFLATLYGYASSIAMGNLLSLSRQMAEMYIDGWNADPTQTFLYALAVEFFAVTPYPPAFATYAVGFSNSTASPITVPLGYSARTDAGLIFFFVGDASGLPITVPAMTSTAAIGIMQASVVGPDYNGVVITTSVSSLTGITISNSANQIVFGGVREAPSRVELRCRSNWALLALLRTSPTDAYVALALNKDITGDQGVVKVAVFQHYDPDIPGHSPNCVGIYLAGAAAPVSSGQATAVQTAMLPYIGLHDTLKARPCGTASYAPTGTIYCRSVGDIAAVTAARDAAARQLQKDLNIGDSVLAFEIRRRVADIQPPIRNFTETLADYIPAKSALVAVDFSGFVVTV